MSISLKPSCRRCGKAFKGLVAIGLYGACCDVCIHTLVGLRMARIRRRQQPTSA